MMSVFDAVRAAKMPSYPYWRQKTVLTDFSNCAGIGKLLKNPCFLQIRRRGGGNGDGAKLILRIAYVVRSLY